MCNFFYNIILLTIYNMNTDHLSELDPERVKEIFYDKSKNYIYNVIQSYLVFLEQHGFFDRNISVDSEALEFLHNRTITDFVLECFPNLKNHINVIDDDVLTQSVPMPSEDELI